MSDPVTVVIGADTTGLRRGVQEAKDHVSTLIGSLKEFKSEEIQQGRMSTFLANQIGNIGVVSKGVAGDVAKLISGFAFGGGIGVAVESVKLLVEAWHESGAAAKKATQEAVDSINTLHDKVVDYVATLRNETEAEKMRRTILAPMEKEAADLRADLVVLTDKQAAAQDRLNQLAQRHILLSSQQLQMQSGQRDITEKQKQLALLEARIVVLNNDLNKAKKVENKPAIDSAKVLAEQFQDYKKFYDARTALTLKAMQAEDKLVLEQRKAEGDSAAALTAFFDEQWKERLARYMEAQHAVQEKIHETAAAAKELGGSFGTAFAGIASGTMSTTKAFATMAGAILKFIIDMVMKSITAYALQGAAASAAANAGIPGIGWIIAMGAAAAMEAAIMGLISQMPSAAVGMDYVPQDMPVFVHKGERIQTVNEAEAWRSGKGGAGGSGSLSLNVTIHAMDGASVQRVVESDAFRRAIRESQRNGRF